MFIHKKEVLFRYILIIAIMGILGTAIIIKAAIIMFAEKDYWKAVKEKSLKSASIEYNAQRGDILSDNGELMVSSMPEYTLFMDFVTNKKLIEKNKELYLKAKQDNSIKKMKKLQEKDSIYSLSRNLNEICTGLAHIIDDPEWSAARFKSQIQKGMNANSRYFRLYPKRIPHVKYVEIKKLPVLCQSKNISGLISEDNIKRKKIFGSLAMRTLGNIFAKKDSAISGIELKYDSILRGKTGIKHIEKVGDTRLFIIDKPAERGCDIQTTLNIEMQDICEKSLRKMLESLEAEVGLCVLMEVETGDIKAIVNLGRDEGGDYYEMSDYALADLMEPGSIFKTASMMVALDDGKVELSDSVYGYNGSHVFYGKTMLDHNANRGGYGWMSIPEILMYSSNIGIAQVVDDNYGYKTDATYKSYDRYVDKLYQFGFVNNYHLLNSEMTPVIKYKKDYNPPIAKTSLPWMAMGYGVQIPAINMVTFYNTIANNGKMMRPRLVKSILRDGQIVNEFPVEVIENKICKQHTIDSITKILTMVVNDPKGLGKRAKAEHFLVAGKTGTAQIFDKGSYDKRKHLLSFCGFFPADKPKYSCIVQIKEYHGRASGGGSTSAVVFGEIAEQIMAKSITLPLENAIDTTNALLPSVKNGNLKDAGYVLDKINLNYKWDTNDEHNKWGKISHEDNTIIMQSKGTVKNLVPNVLGMGAKDAIFLIEEAGLHISSITGSGRVVSQSPQGGTKAIKGNGIQLTLKRN